MVLLIRSCNSLQYFGKILAKIFARSWQDLTKISMEGQPGFSMFSQNVAEVKTFLKSLRNKFALIGQSDDESLSIEQNVYP